MRIFIVIFTLSLAGCGPCGPFLFHEEINGPDVTDAAGHRHFVYDLMQAQDRVASLFFFVLSDCPISNAYAPEIERITREYEPRGVQTYIVFCDAKISSAEVREHMKAYGLSAGALLDEDLHVVHRVGATIAPEAALVSRGAVHYLGRIDDKFAALGVNREVITQRNLRDALDAFLDGRPIESPRVAAVGCYISRD
jgi:hypothetical protein